jgi:RHH-type proline utilization regulon transcriptional repressor/proline dehydrogenase/delta 1-pyrroline-5-carboxylate dehydrogenase
MGRSAFGPGIKAGGPNYVAQLMDFVPEGEPRVCRELTDPHLAELHERLSDLTDDPGVLPADQLRQVLTAIGSYSLYMDEEFGREHDHFRLIGQDNFRRYLPVEHLRVRIHEDDTFFEVFGRVCAAKAAGCRITISIPRHFDSPAVKLLEELTESWAAAIEFVEESDNQLASVILRHLTDRVRYALPDRVPEVVYRAMAETGQYVAATPVLAVGRIELLWYLREQSLCIDYHRYGNLGARADEPRSNTL